MPPNIPVEFLRRLANNVLQHAGNRVQLEDPNGTHYDAANPLPIQAPPGAILGTVGIDQITANANHVEDVPLNTVLGTIMSAAVNDPTASASVVALLKGLMYKGRGTTKSVTFARPNDATPYAAKDSVNVNLTVTGATNATPIVIAATAHGVADGDYVTIASVGGNTAANVSCYVKATGYDADHFALYSDKALTTAIAGNGDYTAGGTVARLFRLKGIFRTAGGSGYITRVRLLTNSATALLADTLQVHFYGTPVAVVVDNSPHALLWANAANREGLVVMPSLTTEGSGSNAAYSLGSPGGSATNLPLYVENGETPADTDLWCRLEELSTGTPAANQQFMLEVTLDNN